ncbi:pilus assembly protein CpaE [Palleronia aestuarii]|uniref:Pilus assembly protein CpaE n=1 Tax=Palleronia aestuarii TaxID=568105 RepID=A0A2W7NII6_9RHOB|nr:AAA family ATPase [Palleronia aestuarii]PZX19680.1 pilus assembly protein CpaE [Palleronia aestuarii]
MTSTTALAIEQDLVRACTICRDVEKFDLLIEDMEAELGAAWGDLSFSDAASFLRQPEADALEFVAIAMDEADEGNTALISELIRTACSRGIGVVVIAEEVSPMVLHQLLKLGAREFVPYPLPDGALREAVERMRKPEAPPAAPAPPQGRGTVSALKSAGDRNAVILPVHALAGGAGASTFAVNLAWELALSEKTDPPRVCLLDLDLQMGAVATYLDLAQRDAVMELLTNTDAVDSDSFLQALVPFRDRLHVLTSPAEMLPLDLIGPDEVSRLLDMAACNFDYVVIDMPSTIVQWTETVLNRAHVYFTLLELDMRSAQNTLKMIRALKSENLPIEKLRFMLNRAPGFTDLAGKSRLKRLAESLDIGIEVRLPDGGKPVTEANDQGLPLAEGARKNPLRREIQKIAASIHELNRAASTAS